MPDLKDFGTAVCPLRCSGLGLLVQCPWRSASVFLAESDGGESGAAADTGSAAHLAVKHFHKHGKDAAASLAAMQAGRKDYPLADLQDAAALFLAYAADPRNQRAEVVLCEEEVKFTIQPTAWDPTQAPIEVDGHVDQVRDEGGILRVWDYKSSRKDPSLLSRKHTYQLAGYCIGATVKLGRPVHPGGLILARRYGDGKNPFYGVPWSFEDLEQIMEAVRVRVAEVRSGQLYHVPGEVCDWCHFRSPDVCLPELQKFKRVPLL